MCLFTRDKTSSIAECDIECYKVYKFTIRRKYISPYQGAKMPTIGEVAITELDESGIIVEKGFHSFASLNSAKAFKGDRRYLTIFKCVIPKGAKYYKGFFVNDVSYCSDMIIIKEEVCV